MRKPPRSPEPRILFQVGGLPPPFVTTQMTVHPRGWDLRAAHRHTFYQLVFDVKGSARLDAARRLDVKEGQLAVVPPGLLHDWQNVGARSLDMMNIHIDPDATDLVRYLDALTSDRTHGTVCPERMDLLPLAERVADEVKRGEAGHKQMIATHLMQIVVGFLRSGMRTLTSAAAKRERPSLGIEKALWFIEGNYRRDLTLDDVARVLHVGPKHACHVFNREVGTSPMRYLRATRVEKAKSLLELTNYRVGEVADMVGVQDEHHFSRLFKRETGMSPVAYRDRHRG